MSRVPVVRALAAFVIAGALALPVAAAARPLPFPAHGGAATPSASAGLLASLWQSIVRIWTDNGSTIDPYGGG